MTTDIIEPPRVTMDECDPQHPTTVVMACSPDTVLTHDNETSQACRRCRCGRAVQHVDLCNRPEAVAQREKQARIRAAIDARPLDVYDIAGVRGLQYQHAKMGDHWYWCRHHRRAEHVGWAMDGCIRVGPFMSEREATILRREHPEYPEGDKPLGMEVEA